MSDRRDARNAPTARPHVLALGVVADAPETALAKLSPPLPASLAADLARAMLADFLGSLAILPIRHRILLAAPEHGGVEALSAIAPPAWKVIPQRGSDPGARISAAFEDLFALKTEAAAVLRADVPLLPLAELYDALTWLPGPSAKLALGPCEGGGAFVLGLTRSDPEVLTAAAPWASTGSVDAARPALDALGVEPRALPSAYRIDSLAHLRRLARDLKGPAGSSAPSVARLLGEPTVARLLGA